MGIFISVNMCSSIDGKIASKKRTSIHMGTPYDRKRMREIRKDQDAVIMGNSTFRVHPYILSVGKKWQSYRKKKKLSMEPATVLLSSSLSLPRTSSWEKASHVERLVFCGKKNSKSRRQSLEKNGVRVFVSSTVRPKASSVVRRLHALGYKNILLEGGGELNGSFFEEDLVDRIYLTLAPYIVGGADSPTICDGIGFSLSSVPKWKLKEYKKYGNELYLVYDRHSRSHRRIS